MGNLVTLAMPVYNASAYIEQALLSALDQTFEALEIIIIDDKGSDNSMTIVNDMLKNHHRKHAVRIIEHSENRGTGATRNTAIDHTNTPYLCFMDSDDSIPPDAVSILYQRISSTKADLVGGGRKVVSSNGEECTIKSNTLSTTDSQIIAKSFFTEGIIHVATWAKIYDIEFLRKHNIRAVDWHTMEDVWFSAQVFLSATHVEVVPQIVYNYFEREESTSAAQLARGFRSKKELDNYRDIAQRLYERYLLTEDSEIQKCLSSYLKAVLFHCQSKVERSAFFTNKEKLAILAEEKSNEPNLVSGYNRGSSFILQKNILKIRPTQLRYWALKIYSRFHPLLIKANRLMKTT